MTHASCPPGGERPLARGEIELARSVFGDEIDYSPVTIRRRKWFPFQPRGITMTPCGHMHFHPRSNGYCDDFSAGSFGQQGHFIHEMTHVWQTQRRGKWWLVLNRDPWIPYHYSIKPGWPLTRYGIEQQAEIVRHAFLLRKGISVIGATDPAIYDQLVRFRGAAAV